MCRAAAAHNEVGALVFQATGCFVSDIWKLDQHSSKPQYKTHRSVRKRWQVLSNSQEFCKTFRNKQDAIEFAKTVAFFIGGGGNIDKMFAKG